MHDQRDPAVGAETPLVLLAPVIAVAVCVGLVLVTGPGPLSGNEFRAASEQTTSIPGDTKYGVNASGQTFGSLSDADYVGDEPDLVLVVLDDGGRGYVPKGFFDTATALEFDESGETSGGRSSPVTAYNSDGKTPVGTYTPGVESTPFDTSAAPKLRCAEVAPPSRPCCHQAPPDHAA